MLRKPIWLILIVLALLALACGSSAQPGSRSNNNEESVSGQSDTSSGKQVFEDFGCAACHDGPAGIAPSLDGLYGKEVTLENGETVTADDDYLRESILEPQAKIVEGYQPVMPGFENQLSNEELESLLEYIRSLGDE